MTPDWKKILSQVPVQSFRNLLSALINLRNREVEPLPVISVSLANGQSFTGTPVALDSVSQQEILVMHAFHPIDRWQSTSSVTYLLVQQIVGLRFEEADADAVIGLITGGKIQSVAALEPVTKLAFQRFAKEKSDHLASQIHPDFSLNISALLDSVSDFAPFKLYLDKTAAILTKMLADPMGKEALQTGVRQVALGTASSFSVRLQGQILHLDLAADEIAKQKISDEDLKAAIEKVL
jgi:hypothetical protein